MDWLIVMGDVYGVADISKKCANFLTVSRKFGYYCVYVFHVIAPATQQTLAGAGKRQGDSNEHPYRRDRKSARPKFLSGR